MPALNLIDLGEDEGPELLFVAPGQDLDLVVDDRLVEQAGHEDDEVELGRSLAEELPVPPFDELDQLPQGLDDLAVLGGEVERAGEGIQLPHEPIHLEVVLLLPLLADHAVEELLLLVRTILPSDQLAIDHKEHESQENVSFFEVEGPEEVAFSREVEDEGRCEGEVLEVCPFVHEEIQIAVGVVLVLRELNRDDAAVLVVVVIDEVVVD